MYPSSWFVLLLVGLMRNGSIFRAGGKGYSIRMRMVVWGERVWGSKYLLPKQIRQKMCFGRLSMTGFL
tara:strand:+ start:255 stop:458 length:204 start_codon:yes stop_codon:yes gene_type:complete